MAVNTIFNLPWADSVMRNPPNSKYLASGCLVRDVAIVVGSLEALGPALEASGADEHPARTKIAANKTPRTFPG